MTTAVDTPRPARVLPVIVLSQFAGTVPPGTNAIIAETVEEDTSILDNAVAQRGGVVVRWTLDEVLDALDAQQDAAEEAGQAAETALDPGPEGPPEAVAPRDDRRTAQSPAPPPAAAG